MVPGADLSFHYSGKGPLPEPKEFVIPLEKPLPLGTVAHLPFKNFYVGKMEATTQTLETRHYDSPIQRNGRTGRARKLLTERSANHHVK